MSIRVVEMSEQEAAALGHEGLGHEGLGHEGLGHEGLGTKDRPDTRTDGGVGTLRTDRGNLPLESVQAAVRITGLVARTELTQRFHNPHDVPLEATYVFPLPDRAAVTAMRMTAADRTVEARLRERGAAREEYDQALAEGRRAAIAEEERPDVFTMRVGNIVPGERVEVGLTLVGPLPYEDAQATYRLPLVVAPRYIPGTPTGSAVGDGYAPDTDAVPDASRITPPVLLPGFPNPVRLGIEVDIDPGGLPLGEVRSSLHAVAGEGDHLHISPGERLNRDFVLRLAYGEAEAATQSMNLTPDPDGDEGTFQLTILPPTTAAVARPRDVVLLLDRSGSMKGWKMVAARRAAARIVDTLTAADRFSVLAFDHMVEHPDGLEPSLQPASDRNRFRAVSYLATVDARGGTELLAPLSSGLGVLADATRDRVLVLVTDGQVGNEDEILARCAQGLAGVRVHTVGIDQAVNAGFLGRLAAVGGGRCELVESEDRLDAAMAQIHRRIAAPVVSGLTLEPQSIEFIDDTVTPARLPNLFPGAPLVVTGRYRGAGVRPGAAVRVTGRTRRGEPWSAEVPATLVPDASLAATWARGHLRDLEDRYAALTRGHHEDLERRIVATSERFGVLCRFTAWVAVDERVVVEANGTMHKVIQPVEPAAGWDMLAPPAAETAPMMWAAAFAPDAAMRAGGPVGAMRTAALARDAVRFPDALMAAGPGGFLAEKAREAEPPDVLALMRTQAGDEAERLRAASDADWYERRELLVDLGTRLEALARGLVDLGAPVDEVAALRDLAAALAEDRLDALSHEAVAALWDRALALLDGLARP